MFNNRKFKAKVTDIRFDNCNSEILRVFDFIILKFSLFFGATAGKIVILNVIMTGPDVDSTTKLYLQDITFSSKNKNV